MMHTREHVEERPIRRLGETHAVGGDDRHTERLRQRGQRRVLRLFVALQMALQFDHHLRAPEQADEPIEQPADAVMTTSST